MIPRKISKYGLVRTKFESLWTTAGFDKDYPDEEVKDFAYHIWMALHLSDLGNLLKIGPGYTPGETSD